MTRDSYEELDLSTNAVQAHMVRLALERAEIPVILEGESVYGGTITALPLRILVPRDRVEEALRILEGLRDGPEAR
jgi:hypothetical protein